MTNQRRKSITELTNQILFWGAVLGIFIWTFLVQCKGGFCSEGTDAFVISSNRRNLLFSWVWILKFWYFQRLESCHIRTQIGSEGWNKASFCYLSLQNRIRLLFDIFWALWNITNSKWKPRKIIRFVCLRKWQMHQYLLNKSHLY